MSKIPPSPLQNFLYKFEAHLPLYGQDGRRIEQGDFLTIKNQLVSEFGSVTITIIWGSPVYNGAWIEQKSRYQKKTAVFTVLAPQDDQGLRFFLTKKEEWKQVLRQDTVIITYQEIQLV